MEQGMIKIRKSIRDLNTKKVSFFSFQKLINLHKITLQEKYTLLFASLLLFLIGAALGAIIRKGSDLKENDLFEAQIGQDRIEAVKKRDIFKDN